MIEIEQKLKSCPFCAEPIQERAVKCRFCNEFLNTDKARAILTGDEDPESTKLSDVNEQILFAGRPSLWGIAGSVIRALFFWAISGALIVYPVESLFELSAEQVDAFGLYRVIAGIGLAVLVLLILIFKIFRLKMIYYEVTADRIEWSRGIFDRRVDNLDMFRVVDLKLRRTLLDCILGIGTVGLITNDKTDPKFDFEKIRDARYLYDIIKTSSLDADQRRSVIHIE